MGVIRKTYAAQTDGAGLGPREVRVTCSTDTVDRAGEVIDQGGIDLSEFALNPILLWSHDPAQPIGTVTRIGVVGGKLQALVEFAPAGISHKADEICGLVKAGIVKTVSVGFDVDDMEPMDPKQPRGPQRYLRIRLLELSFVSIPCNPEAIVVERAMGTKADKEPDWKVGVARDLPIEDSDAWDGDEAQASIFAHAGGDEFDPDVARKGFLAYDAANPKLRGSYKLPIAHVVDGEMKVPKGAIRAAASRLPDSDLPDTVKESAAKVLATYKKKAGIGDEATGGKGAARPRGKQAVLLVKGLCDIGRLAWLLEDLGWIQAGARIETALEGDESKIPALLAAVMQDLGAALVAMTQEEVTEALEAAKGETDPEDVAPEDLTPEAVALVLTGATAAARKFRAGYQRAAGTVKAGRTISAATAQAMQDAMDMHGEAMDHHRAAMRLHRKAMDAMGDLMDKGAPGATEGAEDGDSDEVQTSAGDEEDDGATKSMAARQRIARALELAEA